MADEAPRRAVEGEAAAAADPSAPAEKEPTRFQKAQKTYSLVSDIFTPTRLLLLLGVIAVAVVGMIGGWDRVAAVEEALPSATPSAVATATPFELTVGHIRYGTELKPIAPAREGVRYLFLVADIVNTSDHPLQTRQISRAVSIDAEGLSVAPPMVYRTGDALMATWLQPDVPTQVVYLWEQDAATPLPETVDVTILSQTWRASALSGALEWMDPTAVAEMTLPLSPIAAES